MDLAFNAFRTPLADDRASPVLDHGLLVAAVAAQRSAMTATAPSSKIQEENQAEDPLTIVLLGDFGWREASRVQRGCFNRAEAGRRINVR